MPKDQFSITHITNYLMVKIITNQQYIFIKPTIQTLEKSIGKINLTGKVYKRI